MENKKNDYRKKTPLSRKRKNQTYKRRHNLRRSPLKKWKVPKNTVCSSCGKERSLANKTKKLCITCVNNLKKEKERQKREEKKKIIGQAKLDQVTSWLVRTLYPAKCPHCGVKLEFKTSNCGHFVSRVKQATRFSLKNLCAIDRNCNFYVPEHVWSLGKYLDEVWGDGTADEQIELAKKQLKLTPHKRKEIYDIYREILDRAGDVGTSWSSKFALLQEAQAKYEEIVNPLIK